jgi:FAD/FMN-containing dehydrogenase
MDGLQNPDSDDALIASLRQVLGADGVAVDMAERQLYSADLFLNGPICRAVIRPSDAQALSRAMEILNAAGIAVAPRGGGYSYTGGYIPGQEDMVMVDMAGMNRIIEISEEDMFVTAEAGVTWKQLYEALLPKGLRLPFFGTYSGSGATVGGGISNGALFLGTARYGTVSEIVLGLEVVLADGTVLTTGQGGVTASPKPFFRTFGPDLTGLFVHDAGALGIKTRATLRLIRTPAETDYLSFAFPKLSDAIAAISEVGRAEAAEDSFVIDPASAARNLTAQGLGADIGALAKVVAQERGFIKGLKAGLDLVRHGRDFAPDGAYLLNLVLAGKSRAAVEHDIETCRRIAADNGGAEIPNSLPKAARANLFPPLDSVVGPDGRRWAALNAKVAHSQARTIVEGAEAIFDRYRSEMEAHTIQIALLFTVITNNAFSYECVFRWKDDWTALHRRTMSPDYAKSLGEPAVTPGAWALVDKIRAEITAFFKAQGAASSQIGKTYHYLDALKPETQQTIQGIKALFDPKGLMNPGALGLKN